MRNQALSVGAALLMVLWSGCSGEDSGSSGGGSGGTSPSGTGSTPGSGGGVLTGAGGVLTGAGGGAASGTPPVCEGRTVDSATGNSVIVADTAHNYSFSSTLTLTPAVVTPSSNLHFDWSGVTQDFLGHPVDPVNDIDMLMLVVWDLSPAQFAQNLNDDKLAQRNMNIFCTIYPMDSRPMTSGDLFNFNMMRGDIDPDPVVAEQLLRDYLNPELHDPATTTYTIMTQKGEVLGNGTQMIQAFAVDAASTNTTVNITNTSTTLQYTANIQNAQKTYVPLATPTFTVDWSGLTVNSMGVTVEPVKITDVMVSHYTQTPAELEGDLFLDLELIADASWSGSLETIGTSFDLSKLETTPGSGSFFPGITDSGTWLLALRCGDCRNPAPWFMTVLAPCTQ